MSTPASLTRAAAEFHAAEKARAKARDKIRAEVQKAHAKGMSEYALTNVVRVQRRTIRNWLGKP